MVNPQIKVNEVVAAFYGGPSEDMLVSKVFPTCLNSGAAG